MSRQISLQDHEFEFIHDHKQRHRKIITESLLSETQKKFFTDLLETEGVIKITVKTTSIFVWIWPGFEWNDIEPKIEKKISSCPITDSDLEEQKEIVIKDWKENK